MTWGSNLQTVKIRMKAEVRMVMMDVGAGLCRRQQGFQLLVKHQMTIVDSKIHLQLIYLQE